MSFLIEKSTPFGTSVKARYWRVVQTNINWYNRTASVQMAGFTDADSYGNGAQAIAQVTFEWYQDRVAYNIGSNQVQFDSIFPFTRDGNVIAAAYTAIAALETWQNAINC